MTIDVTERAERLLLVHCREVEGQVMGTYDPLALESAQAIIDDDDARLHAEVIVQAIELLCPAPGLLARLGFGALRVVGLQAQLALRALIARLLRGKPPLDEDQLIRATVAAIREPGMFAVGGLVGALEHHLASATGAAPSASLRAAMEGLQKRLLASTLGPSADDKRLWRRLQTALASATGDEVDSLFGETIERCSAWSAELEAWFRLEDAEAQDAWRSLFAHSEAAAGKAKPTKRWSKQAAPLIETIGAERYAAQLASWLGEVKVGWTERQYFHDDSVVLGISDLEQDRLKGLLWAAAELTDSSLAHAIGRFGERCFRKIKDLGPASTRLGNACVVTLGAMPGGVGVAMLSRLAAKVRYGSARTQIDRALTRAAEAAGQTKDDLEELAVPDFGLSADAPWQLTIGGGDGGAEPYRVELNLGDGDKLEPAWLTPDGKRRKTPPKELRERHGDELKAAKATIKELGDLLEGQALRLEKLYLKERRLPLADLRARYIDHPVVSRLARRLLWTVRREGGSEGGNENASEDGREIEICWREGELTTLGGQTVELSDTDEARLWHPLDLGDDLERLQIWRDDLADRGVTQPFKQLWREVYAPLPVEEGQGDGKGDQRFAGQIIRQHLLRHLCQQRGWQYTVQGHWDSHNWPSKPLPRHELEAQLQADPIGHDGDMHVFSYLITGELFFLRSERGMTYTDERVPLEQLPPLVFSEVLRDVDLFIGVSTAATDPDFDPRDLDERWLVPWQEAVWGDLAPVAQTRRAVLAKVLPRTTLRESTELTDRELLVSARDGARYRIHLGSANVRPVDEVVEAKPLTVTIDRKARKHLDAVFLPFEGDSMLKTILAKAFVLANTREPPEERRLGLYAGQIGVADDFDELPPDMQAAFEGEDTR